MTTASCCCSTSLLWKLAERFCVPEVALRAVVAYPPTAGRPIGACPAVLNGVATPTLPMSLELATVLKAVSVGGGLDSSGRCSTFSLVNSSFEGASSGTGPSSILSVVGLDGSSAMIVGSSTSSATGGAGASSTCGTGSGVASTAGVSVGAGVCSLGGAAGFAAGFGGVGSGLGANMLAHVFLAATTGCFAASTGCFSTSEADPGTFSMSSFDSAAGVGFASDAPASAAGLAPQAPPSVVDGESHAADSVVGIDEVAREPVAAPPRPPRKPPRPRSVPRPRPPRTLSAPRRGASPRAERTAEVESVGANASFVALERDRSFAFLGTSLNWETAPGVGGQWGIGQGSSRRLPSLILSIVVCRSPSASSTARTRSASVQSGKSSLRVVNWEL
jgi:hypothetical protein